MTREYDKKVKRLIRLYDRLHSGQTLFLPDLSKEFKVSLRSLQRDMAELQELYVPVQAVQKDERHGYALPAEARRFPVNFGLSDVVIVKFALSLMQQYEGTGLAGYLRDLAGKVGDRLNQTISERIEGLEGKFHSHHAFRRNFKGKENQFDAALTALIYQKKLRVRYHAVGGEGRSYTIHPYTLLSYKSGLYLIARVDHAPAGARPSVFALERMERCRALDERFDMPRGWNPKTFLPELGGLLPGREEDVEIDFDASLETYLKHLSWPRQAKFTKTGEGKLRLAARLTLSDELVGWLVGFRAMAVVVSPADFRQRLRNFLSGALEGYWE